jgi:hypothetical protein
MSARLAIVKHSLNNQKGVVTKIGEYEHNDNLEKFLNSICFGVNQFHNDMTKVPDLLNVIKDNFNTSSEGDENESDEQQISTSNLPVNTSLRSNSNQSEIMSSITSSIVEPPVSQSVDKLTNLVNQIVINAKDPNKKKIAENIADKLLKMKGLNLSQINQLLPIVGINETLLASSHTINPKVEKRMNSNEYKLKKEYPNIFKFEKPKSNFRFFSTSKVVPVVTEISEGKINDLMNELNPDLQTTNTNLVDSAKKIINIGDVQEAIDFLKNEKNASIDETLKIKLMKLGNYPIAFYLYLGQNTNQTEYTYNELNEIPTSFLINSVNNKRNTNELGHIVFYARSYPHLYPIDGDKLKTLKSYVNIKTLSSATTGASKYEGEPQDVRHIIDKDVKRGGKSNRRTKRKSNHRKKRKSTHSYKNIL